MNDFTKLLQTNVVESLQQNAHRTKNLVIYYILIEIKQKTKCSLNKELSNL